VTATADGFTVAGTAKVVRFNWPKYVLVAGLVAAAVVAGAVGAPWPVTASLGLVAGAGATWTVTSLVATWWVYDHRRVYDQVAVGVEPIGTWAGVHAGFDDATAGLTRVIGHGPATLVELSMHAGPSLRRARGVDDHVAAPGAPDGLPLTTGALDALFVTFAAHEIRDPDDQRALFGELRRALAPGGRLIITEHLRDAANVTVYGPGALHFQTWRNWTRRADDAGLTLVSAVAITPFVRRGEWRR